MQESPDALVEPKMPKSGLNGSFTNMLKRLWLIIIANLVCPRLCYADFTMNNNTGTDLWVAVLAQGSSGFNGVGKTIRTINGFISLNAGESTILPSGHGNILIAARPKTGNWLYFNRQSQIFADDFRRNSSYQYVAQPVAEALDSGEKIPFNSTGITSGGTFTLNR